MKIEKGINAFLAGMFISLAGLFVGFGLGFIANNVLAGVFLGLGLSFVGFSISFFLKK